MKLKNLFPKQFDFFAMFRELAGKVAEVNATFTELLTDPSKAEFYSRKIHDLEGQADALVHGIIAKLHETFVTPMDRNNIHLLALRVDDLVDIIHAASQRIFLYKIDSVSAEVQALGELARQSIADCCVLVSSLDSLKNPSELQKLCVNINGLENAADDAMRRAIVNLFESETDFKAFIKQKELIELLEQLTDKGEAVAHLVESLILEHA